MFLKKKNTLVGIINLILGILGCICWFTCVSCVNTINNSYISSTDVQETLVNIFVLLLLVPMAFTFIINLIYIFKNWHNKKSMFMNILTIIAIIFSIVLSIFFESKNYIYI